VWPLSGQSFEGWQLGTDSSEHRRTYLVIETATLALAVRCDEPLSIPSNAEERSWLRVEARAVSGSQENPTQAWLISQRDNNGNWTVLTPWVEDRAARHGASHNIPSELTPETASHIRAERNWLDRHLESIHPDPKQSGETTRTLATNRILGQAYQEALRAQYYRRAELALWEERRIFAAEHPEEVNFAVLQQRFNRAKTSLEEADQSVRNIEAAAHHPKVKGLIDALEQKLVTQQKSILERMGELQRLENFVRAGQSSPQNSSKASPQLIVPIPEDKTDQRQQVVIKRARKAVGRRVPQSRSQGPRIKF
jgi:hypothetical protein